MNTLVVSSLYTRDQPIATCAPKSLKRWFKANNVEHKQPKDCEVKIQEVDSGRSDYIEYIQITTRPENILSPVSKPYLAINKVSDRMTGMPEQITPASD